MRLFFPGSRVWLFRCHGNEFRRNENFRLWILASTHSEIVKAGYFPMYSPLAIFAVYFVFFPDEIECKQLLGVI